jgi:NAD(P)-dependent dehydrogenase (short-subunit alcohol dehydrogenase family)
MLLRGGAMLLQLPVFRGLGVALWARIRFHGLGTQLENSRIRFETHSVEIFCNFIEQKYERLDILINNAAQTVRRPADSMHI